jgi:hypothetical protein
MKPGEISFAAGIGSSWPVLSRQTGRAVPEEAPVQAGDSIAVSSSGGKDGAALSPADMQKAMLARSASGVELEEKSVEPSLSKAADKSGAPDGPAAPKAPSVPVSLFQEDNFFSVGTFPENKSPEKASSSQNACPCSSSPVLMDEMGENESGFDVLLQPVADDKKQYGLSMQPSCACGRMGSLRDRVREELQADLPSEYEEFLTHTNGLDYDGLVFYGSEPGPIAGYDDRVLDGVVEANMGYRENGSMGKMLVLGESEDYLYVFDSQKSTYHAVDSTSLKKCEHYTSFRELLAGALISRV